MKNTKWLPILWIAASLLPVGNGLSYFFGGNGYVNSDLRNYAVTGQIILGLASLCYGIWLYKNTARKLEQ